MEIKTVARLLEFGVGGLVIFDSLSHLDENGIKIAEKILKNILIILKQIKIIKKWTSKT